MDPQAEATAPVQPRPAVARPPRSAASPVERTLDALYGAARMPAPLRVLAEYWHVRRASRRLLNLYHAVRDEQSERSDQALYQDVVMRWSEIHRHDARAVLRRAEQSVADWDADRELRFRDVVLYVITEEYLRAHPQRQGARSRMAKTVARVIPRNL